MKSLKLFLLLITLSTLNGKQLRFTLMDMIFKNFPKTGYNTILNKLNLIVEKWFNLANTFSKQITKSMTVYLPGIGFDKFKSSLDIYFGGGFKILSKYKLWVKHILKKCKVPSKFIDSFAEHIFEDKYIEHKVYGDFLMLYNKDDPKNDIVKFLHLISFSDENEDNISFILTRCKIDFKLAPDVIIMRKSKFIAGDTYISSEPYDILKPKTISSNDMELILKFFSFSMIKMMAQSFGLKLFPSIIGPY